MFLRRYTRKKDGKPHTDYALVESVRTEAGPRQNVVAYLGELNHDQERRWQRTVVFHNRQRGESGSDLVLSGFHGTSLIIAWAFQASCDLGQLPDQGRRSSEGLVHATRQVRYALGTRQPQPHRQLAQRRTGMSPTQPGRDRPPHVAVRATAEGALL